MRNKWFLVVIGLLLLSGMQIAMAQNRNTLTIARDRLVLQLDLQSSKKAMDSVLNIAGISKSSAGKLVAGDFSDIINDGWEMASHNGNLIEFDRSLVNLNNNPQDQPNRITAHIPSLEGRPGYPAEVTYGVNKYAKIMVYELSSGLTRFILPGYERSKRVFLSGSFNSWSTLKGLMKKADGGWMLDIPLAPGAYEYKYIVDGRWTTDPNNLIQVNDGAGNRNSVFYKYNYTFTMPGNALAHRITVAGNFNEWDANELVMEKKGNVWQKQMYLAEGQYYYRFMVDGQWVTDPANPLRTKEKAGDEFSHLNSVLYIGEKVTFKLQGYPNAKKVMVSGDFNNWNADELSLKRAGNAWALSITLKAGNYNYRFIVDGESITDPLNPHYAVEDGKTNSFLAVRPNYTFKLKGYKNAKKVTLCGVFNDWQPDGYTMEHKGDVWSVPFYLKPGKYLYKFRVDGEWIIDPGNKLWEPNEPNTGNSVLWME